ncbi:hypothetical protein HHL08_19015 [Sphingobium sp. AR-3-1]|uniref:Alpha/beta hydrolase n=1 Tax=Sphingobium psychrophilum TaxID=2728834 RepID=A0A7X9ZV24_9SPHN|nr:hypothetical protein [Sphingobium psychrophilum]NML12206.1 hypothetical protein [Sphingobium psychrophilum]
MKPPIEISIDVTDAAVLGTPAQTAVSVFLPDGPLCDPPVVCFAFPGGGYSRRYYAFDLPHASGGGEAGFHCDRGWIFVACDHLGFGDSTIPEGNALNLDNAAAANHATVRAVMARLEDGTLADGLPPVTNATVLGIGQSMGGCFTVVAQGNWRTFDGIGVLGYSAIHTIVPTRPGSPQMPWPWISRRSSLDAPHILNDYVPPAMTASGEHPFQWSFHYDDEPADIVALDMAAAAGATDPLPDWRSATTPPCGIYMVAPGAVAQEAAAVRVPVLIAAGERDVVPDPWAEPKAYKSATDITVYVCSRMAHMHNFAHTRALLWQKIHDWGSSVAALRALTASSTIGA